MAWFEPELESLLAVAAALLDEGGKLLEANAGFLWLIKMEKVQPIVRTWSNFSFNLILQPSSAHSLMPKEKFTMDC